MRLGTIVLALAASAWFGLGWYQASKTGQATALITSGSTLSAAQARRAEQLLDSAGALNPDRTVTILRGDLAAERHQNRAAVDLLQSVTRSEPQDLAAWVQLVFAAEQAHDQALALSAGRMVSSLIPNVTSKR